MSIQREALEAIVAMDPDGLRADDLGRAASIARAALPAPTERVVPEGWDSEAKRAEFKAALGRMPKWAPEFEKHRPWVEQFAWFVWCDARRAAPSPAEPATHVGGLIVYPTAMGYFTWGRDDGSVTVAMESPGGADWHRGVPCSLYLSGQAAPTAVQPAAQVQEAGGVDALIDRIRRLPTVRAPEIDGEESDGTPRYWRNRPYVSLTQLEALLRAAQPATPVAPSDLSADQRRTVACMDAWSNMCGLPTYSSLAASARAETATPVAPIDVVLHCPACGMQHIDAPEAINTGPDERGRQTPSAYTWTNPPHRSHLCHGCGHIWRPADVPTNGVAEVKTKGKADRPVTTPVAPKTLEALTDADVQRSERIAFESTNNPTDLERYFYRKGLRNGAELLAAKNNMTLGRA